MPDESGSKPVAFPDVAKLMSGKRGLIMGVANERSIAWGIAQALHAAGAELAFTYQGAAFGKRVIPMVEKLGSKIVVEADVENEQSLQALFGRLQRDWGKLDFVVHAIAFSDKEELKGRYVDTTKANFQRSLTISCYSFTEIARLALPLMSDGGSHEHPRHRQVQPLPAPLRPWGAGCQDPQHEGGEGQTIAPRQEAHGRCKGHPKARDDEARAPDEHEHGGHGPDERFLSCVLPWHQNGRRRARHWVRARISGTARRR